MVHDERFSSMPAAVEKSFTATLFERNTMLKTLKRKIALVAVAALGAGSLSVITATSARAAVAVDEVNLVTAGSTLIATAVNNGADPDTAFARPGTQTIVLQEVQAVVNADNYNIAVCIDDLNPAVGDILDANCLTLSSPTATGPTAGDTSTPTLSVAANPATAPSGWITGASKALLVDTNGAGAANGASTVFFNTGSMTAGSTYSVWIDTDPTDNWGTGGLRLGVITVANVGAPASVAWPAASVTQLSATAVDRALNMLVKDSTGANTFLVGDETIAVDISPITGVGTTQVGLSATGAEAAAVTYSAVPVSNATTGYSVSINGNGDGGGVTGTTIPGATYTLTAQLLRGTAAIGAPSALSYKRLSNTAALAGSVSFVNATTTTTAVTTVSSAINQAATAFKIKALDNNGGILQNATVAVSVSGITGTFTGNNQQTGTDGITATDIVLTPTSAGTGTITATITTGTTSITASVPVTSSAYGAIAATVAKTAVVNTNGTGFATTSATAGTYVAAVNVTKIKTTLTGLTPNAAILLAATGGGVANPTSDVGLNPTADSTGTVVVVWTAVTPADTNTITITADADGGGAGAAVTVATITYETALASITTTPADGTATYAAPSSTQEVVADIANQFDTIVSGGTVTFTNTVKPAAATAQTAATVTVGADGKAKFNAVLGSAVGTYTYTATARDVNGATAGTAANHTSTFSFIVNAAGAPAAITVTGGANTALSEFRVLIDPDGVVATNAGAAAAKSKALTTNLVADAGSHTVMTVSVGAAGVIITAKPGDGVLINSAAAATVPYSSFNGATDLAQATDATGVATFYVTTTKPGLNTVEFSAGSTKTTAEFRGVHYNQLDVAQAVATARTVSLDKSTASVAGNIVQITATVKDLWGNAVPGVALTGAVTGAAGRFSGGARTQAAVNTDANGQVVFEVTSNGTETGAGTLTVTGTEAGAATNFLTGDLTANGPAAIFTAASTRTATAALTVTAGSTVGAATETAINNVKTDVKAVSDTVATLSKAVTTIQSSVTELTSSFSAQIKSLSAAIAKISKAIAALSKKIK